MSLLHCMKRLLRSPEPDNVYAVAGTQLMHGCIDPSQNAVGGGRWYGPTARDLDYVLEYTADTWEPLRKRTLFITGATGFVGTWLTSTFLWANDRLGLNARAVLLTSNRTPRGTFAAAAIEHSAVQVIVGDLCTFEFPEGKFPFVIHAGVYRPATPTDEAPLANFTYDPEGTRRVLEFARKHGTERLLFTSSGAVYGPQPPGMTHIIEDYQGAPSTMDVTSVYGQSKRVCEWLCAMYAQQYGFAALIGRLFTFVGPCLPLNRQFAIGNFIRDVIAGGPVRILGDGTPYRSYLYAADLTIWLWRILMQGTSLRPYNVGSPQAITIADLAHSVVAATVPGTLIEIAQKPAPGSVAERYVPSTRRAEQELGLRSRITLHDAIQRAYEWALHA